MSKKITAKKKTAAKIISASKIQKIFTEIKMQNQKNILINARRDSKRNYSSNRAEYFFNCVAQAVVRNPIPKSLAIATKSNAKARREWCEKNNAVIVDRSKVIEKKLISKDRPENLIRIRLTTIKHGEKIGYVRVMSNDDYQKNPKSKKSELVFIYRKK